MQNSSLHHCLPLDLGIRSHRASRRRSQVSFSSEKKTSPKATFFFAFLSWSKQVDGSRGPQGKIMVRSAVSTPRTANCCGRTARVLCSRRENVAEEAAHSTSKPSWGPEDGHEGYVIFWRAPQVIYVGYVGIAPQEL